MAFSTNGTSASNGLSSAINVTPLIDVLLVMLIIFMVIVPVMPRGLNSALPAVSPAGVGDEVADHAVMVQVEQGQTSARYVVNGLVVEMAEVKPRLLELLSRRSARQVLLKADAELDFGVVAGVINVGQAPGADSMELITPGAESSLR